VTRLLVTGAVLALAAAEPPAGTDPLRHPRQLTRDGWVSAARGAGAAAGCRSQPRLFGDGAWIGKANLVPVVIAFGQEPVVPQLSNTLTERAVSTNAGRMMGPSSEEAVLP
jgi:hypothetical protein